MGFFPALDCYVWLKVLSSSLEIIYLLMEFDKMYYANFLHLRISSGVSLGEPELLAI